MPAEKEWQVTVQGRITGNMPIKQFRFGQRIKEYKLATQRMSEYDSFLNIGPVTTLYQWKYLFLYYGLKNGRAAPEITFLRRCRVRGRIYGLWS